MKKVLQNSSLVILKKAVTYFFLITGFIVFTNELKAQDLNLITDYSGEFVENPLTGEKIIYAKIKPEDTSGLGKLDASFAIAYDIIDQWGDPSIQMRFNITDPAVAAYMDIRDGGVWVKKVNIPIEFNKVYHCWFVIRLADKKYDAYVQPDGTEAPVLLAQNAGFRTASVTQLDHWSTFHNILTPDSYLKVETFKYTTEVSLHPTGLNTLSNSFEFFDVYPNPVTSNATFSYRLKEQLTVELALYNIQGQKVKTIVTGKQTAGDYKYTAVVSDLKKGVYFYKFTTGNYSTTKKLLIY